MRIVFLSHTHRNSIYRVGSYYLSKKFTELGHEVLYISSPLSLFHIASNFIMGREFPDYNSRWNYRDIKIDEEGVYNHVPIQLFPFINQSIFNSYKLYDKYNFNFSKTSRQIKELGFTKPDVVIQDSLKLNFCRNYFNPIKWVYRATDLYFEMPDAPDGIHEAEQEAVEYSDHVFATSEPLKDFLEKKYHLSATVLRNGVNFSHFNKPQQIPKEYEKLNGNICVYVGSMDDRFDHQLIKKLAAESQDLNIVLIGPSDRELYDDFKNIICLGEIPNNNLPPYLQHADAGLLPFTMISANHNRSPMKIYEYGASGLPVVSKRLNEIERRGSKFVYLADSDQHFIELVNTALKNIEVVSKQAIEESKQYSWDSITEDLLKVLIN